MAAHRSWLVWMASYEVLVLYLDIPILNRVLNELPGIGSSGAIFSDMVRNEHISLFFQRNDLATILLSQNQRQSVKGIAGSTYLDKVYPSVSHRYSSCQPKLPILEYGTTLRTSDSIVCDCRRHCDEQAFSGL
jgi:hypothetical protein